jgi:O-antigen ligase
MNRAAAIPAHRPSVGRAVKRRVLSPPLMLYFVVLSGSVYLLFGSFYEGELAGKSGNSPIYLGLLGATYAIMLFQLAFVRDAALESAARSLALLAFLCSGLASLYTAGAVQISVMRYGLYTLTILTSLLIATRYSLDEFCENFFWTAFIITVLHLAAYPFLAGKIVYDPLERDTLVGVTSYAGLFPHKSFAGTFFSLAVMISLVRFFGSRARWTRYSSVLLACASGVALLAAGAVGRFLFLLASATVALLVRAALQRRFVFVILCSILLAFAAIFYFWGGQYLVFYLLGRYPNLTGREDVFALWPRFFLEKPLFGYGFDGFFTDVAGSAGGVLTDLNEGRGFATFESDYLDVLIQFGLVGGIFFGCILVSALRSSISYYNGSASKYRFVPVLFVMWSVIGSSLDGGVLIQNSLSCVILFWLYFGVDRICQARRRKSQRRVRSRARLTGPTWRPRLPEELR